MRTGSIVVRVWTWGVLLSQVGACASGDDEGAGDDTGDTDVAADTDDSDTDPAEPPSSGDLDPAFGTRGMLTLDGGAAYAGAIAAQGDDLLVCVTSLATSPTVAKLYRLDQEGVVDAGFGDNGAVTFDHDGPVSCNDITVTLDGDVVVSTYEGTTSALHRLDADGAPLDFAGTSGFSSKLTARVDRNGLLLGGVYGTTTAIFVVTWSEDGNGVGQLASGTVPFTSITRVFAAADIADVTAVGMFDDAGETSWQVLRTVEGAPVPVGADAKASAGESEADRLSDAVELSDGSLFAVGGMDLGVEVMVARFQLGDAPAAMVEHHAHGGPSFARAVAVDSEGRPLVVGSGTGDAGTVYAWSRYEAASVTLDSGYQDGGLAEALPSRGSGELIDVVSLGGAIYALGQDGVETSEPHAVLLRIVE